MKNTEIISYVSIAVIIVSLLFIGTELTGLAVTSNETGLVNVSIESSAALNFTTSLLDFGSGAVSGGAAGATLSSVGAGSVTDGTWAVEAGELILENIGNVNVTLNLSSNKSAADFIGGTSPTFQAIVTENETNSCTGTPSFNSLESITTTPQTACTTFSFVDEYDSVDIDFQLYIPNNAIGAKTVGIIAIGQY